MKTQQKASVQIVILSTAEVRPPAVLIPVSVISEPTTYIHVRTVLHSAFILDFSANSSPWEKKKTRGSTGVIFPERAFNFYF